MSVTQRELIICVEEDLHARPAAQFAQAAVDLTAITVTRPGHGPVDGKSVLQLMGLGVKAGDTITVSANGDDVERFFARITAIVSSHHAQTR